MAYDDDLEHRIRALLADDSAVTERRMFGGLAFLTGGHMAIVVSGQGGLRVRVEPDETDALLAEPGVHPMEMRGRALDGWVRVDADAVPTDRELGRWVERGARYARALPPKAGRAR